jgi:hypothetical protein
MIRPANAVDYNCVPLEVAVLRSGPPKVHRVHVQCAAPAPKTRGGYPTDSGDAIVFFAVSLSANQDWVNRFIQIADIGIASGLTIRYSYTSGDHSGESFGCARQDCRNPWGFALEKIATVP